MQTQNSEITKPCISIITVCFNAQQHIEQTIQSVIAQDYAHIEYIVIDGASTDNTLNIINKYKDSLDYFVSEPDTGISNAMNKGIKAATGDYVLFLHADDYLLSSTSIAEAVRRILTTSSHYDIYAFSILYGQPQLYKQFNSYKRHHFSSRRTMLSQTVQKHRHV
jgi:glycosyltransferase involved in cell wall biosynthesis